MLSVKFILLKLYTKRNVTGDSTYNQIRKLIVLIIERLRDDNLSVKTLVQYQLHPFYDLIVGNFQLLRELCQNFSISLRQICTISATT